jgi:kynurenine formamidase
MKRYVRLSYNISVDTPIYPETPPIIIEKVKEISKGNSCNTSVVTLSNHAGTHIETPYHFFDFGRTITEYSIEEFVFQKPLIIDCPKRSDEAIEIDDISSPMNSNYADMLLIRTGFYKYRTIQSSDLNPQSLYTYSHKNPYLSPKAAEWLRNNHPDIRAIGIDCISISSHEKRDIGKEAHKILLKKDGFKGEPVLIIEDLYLPYEIKKLDELIVSPIFMESVDSSPCTVIGIMQD